MRKGMLKKYTIYFFMVYIIGFLPFLLRGNGLVSEADGFDQSYPVFVYLHDYIRQFLSGQWIQFDFRIGLGDDVLSILCGHGLLDVSSIVLGFFPQNLSEIFYVLSVILKFYLCGISFMVYIGRYVKSRELCIAGALLYAMNIYALRWGLYAPPFLTPLITLPLVLSGVDELCEENKLSIIMIVALLLQGFNGFYFLYMEILVTVIYYCFIMVFRLYKSYQLTIKQIAGKTLMVALNGVIGVGMSGVVLIPSIVGFLSSSREGDIRISTRIFTELEEIVRNFGYVMLPSVYRSIITLPVAAVLGGLVFLCSKKASKEFKILLIVLWLMFLSPIVGSIMNGFSYSTNRWYWAVILFTVVLSVIAMEQENVVPRWIKYAFWCLTVMSFMIHIVISERNTGLWIRVAVFGGFAILLPYLWNYHCHRERYLLVFSALMTAATGLFALGPKVLGGSGYSAGFKANGIYREVEQSISEISSGEEQTQTFERWDVYDSSLGASLMLDYFGTTEYFSVINSYVSEFYREMDISPGYRAASHILRGLDSRRELETLLSVSEFMDYEIEEGERKSVIRTNDDYLPLGFLYDEYILRDEFNNLNPMGKQSMLLNAVVLESEKQGIRANSSIVGMDEELPIDIIEAGEKEMSTRIYVGLKMEQGLTDGAEELYVQLVDMSGNADVYVGNKDILVKPESFLYYTGIDEFWINVSDLEKDERGWYFDFVVDGAVDFDYSNMHVYHHVIDGDAIQKRKEHVMENLVVGNNSISGSVNCRENKFLFLSVPYSTGWKAFVDGEEVEIIRADIGFMAIMLEKAGTHTVELRYVTPGLRLGCIMSLVMIILAVCGHIIFKRVSIQSV